MRFNRRDLIGAIRVKRETIDYIVGRALPRAAISAGYRPKRTTGHKGAARHRRWKRQRVKPQRGITRRKRLAMPPSQMHTSARKGSIRIVLEDRGEIQEGHKRDEKSSTSAKTSRV